jgi:hypothetical protein
LARNEEGAVSEKARVVKRWLLAGLVLGCLAGVEALLVWSVRLRSTRPGVPRANYDRIEVGMRRGRGHPRQSPFGRPGG